AAITSAALSKSPIRRIMPRSRFPRDPLEGAMTASSNRARSLAAALAVAAAFAAGDPAQDGRIATTSKGATASWATRSIEGFAVRVDERLLGPKKAQGEAALAVLQAQLLQIARRLRDEPLARLREIPIWLGLDDPVAPCACYHPSADWLREHGFDRQKAKAVGIAHADAFVAWTCEQPWMVLHELAHGFDDRHLERDGALGRELESLFERAKAGGRYDSVLHWNGERVRHYALENSQEYFAEASEAWLGTNDFFPFVNAELREHDPDLAAFLQ